MLLDVLIIIVEIRPLVCQERLTIDVVKLCNDMRRESYRFSLPTTRITT